mmetsp:Transcript_31311/g.88203  ORF Transcript_31311/g.88203 Transcript_31311/m.88203 type:complete len:437 (+) Transcript_31311:1242-2552(+)
MLAAFSSRSRRSFSRSPWCSSSSRSRSVRSVSRWSRASPSSCARRSISRCRSAQSRCSSSCCTRVRSTCCSASCRSASAWATWRSFFWRSSSASRTTRCCSSTSFSCSICKRIISWAFCSFSLWSFSHSVCFASWAWRTSCSSCSVCFSCTRCSADWCCSFAAFWSAWDSSVCSCRSMASFSPRILSAISWLSFDCSISRSSSCCRPLRCFISSSSCVMICCFSSERALIRSRLSCSFFFACVLTSLHRCANSRVLMDSSRFVRAGLMQARRTVRLFPLSASFRRRVSFDSRNGGCTCFPLVFEQLPARAWMTRLRAESDWLMAIPSWRRSPFASVFFCLSLPARSTKWIFDCRSFPRWVSLKSIVKTACEREEFAFMVVAPTARFLAPKSSSSWISPMLVTGLSSREGTCGPSVGCRRTCRSVRVLTRRSYIFSW